MKLDELEKLKELKEKGVLTDKEFQEQKEKFLNQKKGNDSLSQEFGTKCKNYITDKSNIPTIAMGAVSLWMFMERIYLERQAQSVMHQILASQYLVASITALTGALILNKMNKK